MVGLALLIPFGPALAQEPSGPQAAAALEKALVESIARAEPSVVAIARVRREGPDEALRPEFRPDPFQRRPAALRPPQPTDANFVPTEYGTGVVVDRRGLVLTAYHVLGEDSDYYVTGQDRKVYRAWIKAADPRSDLAVLALDGAQAASANLQPVVFGDGGALRKGQIVLTLGNPYAMARDGQASAGWGIVANLARKPPLGPQDSAAAGKRTLHHFGTLIQTDAKLNLGTSGGPLVNLRGEMVGLCVALAAAAGYESPAGYAIPVDATFHRVLEILKQGREVEYGFLGIQPANLQPEEVFAGLQGARVDSVVRGTPAARWGLRPSDIITSVGGTAIHDTDGLYLEVAKLAPESVAHLGVLRGGRPQAIDVTLSKHWVLGKKIVTVQPEAWRGLRVDYPSAYVEGEQPFRGGALFTDEAVVISEVEPGSPAARCGARRGMLVSHVDGKSVRTPEEFRAALAGKAGPVEIRLALVDHPTALVVPPGS
ncbi:MAG: trypsin-like peptidase domain-containing protein [Thermoguttaceae bacterium]|jgi:S1-C subfamily serine protease